jgi:hypothetical protein
MSDVYRPPVATESESAARAGPRTPWRALAICMAVAWFVIVTRIALGASGWELAPYVWSVLEWMPLVMLVAFLGSLRKQRAWGSIRTWLGLVAAEATLVLPVLFFAWAAPILVTEAVSPDGFRVARSYATCWFVCDGRLFVASRVSPLEAMVEEQKAKVPGEIVWSPDGRTVSLDGGDVQYDLRKHACRPAQLLARPATFLMRCATGRLD